MKKEEKTDIALTMKAEGYNLEAIGRPILSPEEIQGLGRGASSE